MHSSNLISICADYTDLVMLWTLNLRADRFFGLGFNAACAAARRATGTRNGEQLT